MAPAHRRDIKGIRNLQEGRHALARKICHGKKELHHWYEASSTTEASVEDGPHLDRDTGPGLLEQFLGDG